MSTITHWATLAGAFIAAILLICLGKRQLARPGGKKQLSLFSLALTFFLAAYGTSASDAAAQEKETAQVRATVPRKTDLKKKLALRKLPPELSSPKRWAEFKALWVEINAVKPNPKKSKTRSFAEKQPYACTITSNQAAKWRKQLANCMGMMEDNEIRTAISRTCVELGGGEWKGGNNTKKLSAPAMTLASLTRDRITYLAIGDTSRATRMLPTTRMRFNPTLLEDLEKRIDTLVALRKKGKIKDKEFKTALQAVQNDAYLHGLLTVMDHPRRRYFVPQPYTAVPEISATARMKLPVLSPKTNAEKNYARVQMRISKLKQLKKDGKIKDAEYKKTLTSLQQKAKDVLYFDPDAWIRGLWQAREKNLQPAKKDSAAAYSQTLAAVKKYKTSQPAINRTIIMLEEPRLLKQTKK